MNEIAPCPPCITVLPDHFMDGWSGREVKKDFCGLPRIRCMSKGEFQVHQEVFGGCPPGCRPVHPNGFSIVGLPEEDHPNGKNVIIPPGDDWPPPQWPTHLPANSSPKFQDGIPTVTPPWAEDNDDHGGGGNGNGNGPSGAPPMEQQGAAEPSERHGLLRRRGKK